jgi:REP element-mobilizing transposase RayT
MSSASFDLGSDGNAVGACNFHLQFTPAYRRQVFWDAVVKEVCARAARELAARLGLGIAASEFGPDHWHVFLTDCKHYSAEQLAFRFKGYTSWVVRRECGKRLRAILWGDKFWSEGYFYESVGRITNESVQYYITRTQGKHWTKPMTQNRAQTTLLTYQDAGGFSPR